jgi:LPS export ABC transporter permease LptG
MFAPKRLTRYVLAELATPTLLGLLLYTFVLLMNHFFVVAEKSLAKSLGLDLTLRLFLAGIPNLLILAIPMAVLLGSLIGVGRLSADHEWVALQAAGQGPLRLLRAMVIHGLIWSALGFLVYAYLVPQSNYAMRNLRGELLFASNLASDLRPRAFYTDLPNAVLFVEEIRAGTKGRLEGVLLVQKNPAEESTEILLARSGDLYPAPDRSGALLLDLYDGVAHRYEVNSPEDIYHFSPHFEEARERFDPQDFLRGFLDPPQKVVQDFKPRELWAEYRAAVEAKRELDRRAATGGPGTPTPSSAYLAGSRLNRIIIEGNQRVALPLASFFFAVLSLPLGITRVRSGKGAGFALSLLVILVYWASFTFARDQALLGRIPAALGPWAGNLIIAPWAAWGLWRLHRAPSSWPGLLAWLFRASGRALRGLSVGLSKAHLRPAPPNTAGENGEPELPLADLGGTSRRFVGRLDQYIGDYYLRVLIFAILSTYMIYALVETKGLMDGLLRTGEPLGLMLSYYPYFVPGVLYVVLPIACLVGAIVTFTLLARSGELTAIKASGISMRRATASVLLLTTVACGALYLVQDRIAPGANQKAREIKDRILGRAPRTHGVPALGRWGFGPGGRLYHYRLADRDQTTFQGLSVFTLDRATPRILDHRFAERAHWTGEHWELYNGWFRTFPADGSISGVTLERFEYTIAIPLAAPDEFVSREHRVRASSSDLSEQMSGRDLKLQIAELEKSGYDTTQLRVALHGKLAQSFTPLVMVLLGLPFAFKVGRRGSLYGIGVALLLVLVYWAVLAIFNALGLETLLEPWIAAWAPNVFFALFGSYLLLYVRT